MAAAGMALKAGYPRRQGPDVNPQRKISGGCNLTCKIWYRHLPTSMPEEPEIMAVKQIVQEEDLSAFMFITDAHEALGEGFGRLDSDV